MTKIERAELIKTFREVFSRPDGEIRIHLITSKSGGTTTARMWHHDGHIIGKATGYGWDKRGGALGDAIEVLFQPELVKAWAQKQREMDPELGATRAPSHLMALRRAGDPSAGAGRVSVEGGCGLETMVRLLGEIYGPARTYVTSDYSIMIIASKAN